jgi:hypothetical protein
MHTVARPTTAQPAHAPTFPSHTLPSLKTSRAQVFSEMVASHGRRLPDNQMEHKALTADGRKAALGHSSLTAQVGPDEGQRRTLRRVCTGRAAYSTFTHSLYTPEFVLLPIRTTPPRRVGKGKPRGEEPDVRSSLKREMAAC